MMLDIQPGKYVVAVSGGVDSVVLLDLLVRQDQSPVPTENWQPRTGNGVRLVVAHYDHGMRPDSAEDRRLVAAAAKRYGLPFVSAKGQLGPQASEAKARAARYTFLHQVMEESRADAIMTAHHQDDLLETAIVNLLRGTGRLGLSSLRSRDKLIRPLLGYTKNQLHSYAAEHGLEWREDSTNVDDRYLRNYIRHNILPRFEAAGREQLLAKLQRASQLNQELDRLLAEDLARQPAPDQLDRHWFISLPHAVATEAMATWLRYNNCRDFDRALIERLVVAAKTKRPGKLADVDAGHQLGFTKDTVVLVSRL